MWVMVDVEADGPCPGLYSMIELGAVVVEEGLNRTFYAQFAPISDQYIPEALAVSGYSREQTEKFMKPDYSIRAFVTWLQSLKERPMFISDNNGFDWQFVNYYFHVFYIGNPFGHSSTNLGSLYKGFVNNTRKNFKHLRDTKHTHNPVDDAKGNAEAMLKLIKQGLKA